MYWTKPSAESCLKLSVLGAISLMGPTFEEVSIVSSGEPTILVVEDNPGLRALAEEVLSSAGYGVLAAQDGVDALRLAEQYAGPIQLLLTDVTLPQSGGVEIAALLTALRPELKVLFMSGQARAAMTGMGNLEMEVNFIQKPWSPRALCEEVGKLLEIHPTMHQILVVDDEDGMREWLTEILVASGHRVCTAKDGLEAKKLATRQTFDLMITDISMPNEEGLGIIRALRKAHPGLKIIAISGAYAAALMDAKMLGANAALAKPFTSEMLMNCIQGLSPASPQPSVANSQ